MPKLKPKSTPTPAADDRLNQRGLLAWLKIPTAKLRRWEREKGFPRLAGKGVGYSRAGVVAWLIAEVTAPDREHIDHARRGTSYIASYVGEVAAFFGVTPATVRFWLTSGAPGEVGSAKEPGRFDLGEITRWVRDRDGERHKKQVNAETDRVAKLKGDKLDLELRRLNGEVVDRRGAELWLAGYVRRVRDLLERLPAEVAGQTPPAIRPEVEANVSEYISSILIEASSWKIDDEIAAVDE
jgi:hypothetical protein